MELTSLIKTQHEPFDPKSALNVLFATSEIAPFSKTGGLGDVAAALPSALVERRHHASVITPLYGHIDPEEFGFARRLRTLEVPRQGLRRSKVEATIWEGRNASGVRLFFVENEEYFGRDGIYGYDDKSFEDNPARFSFFSRAVVEFVLQFAVPIDVVHCNDWHTALAPIYAKHYYEEEFSEKGFILTLHNLAYQGSFDDDAFGNTGLPKTKYFRTGELRSESGEGVNFLRGGLLYTDRITTVSPTHAAEIQTDEGSHGLGQTLRERAQDLTGILNGADYNVWSPENDTFIEVRYDAENLNGKRRNKAELQHAHDLPVRPTLPMLGFIGRLTEQKGLDILIPALRKRLKSFESDREGFQVVFLGEGDGTYKRRLQALKRDFPKRVGLHIGYEESIAHRIQAGADILLVPSRFEPCGLTQLYALRYGTLPLVHAVGGLADTVIDADADTDHARGTGFVFDDFSEDALLDTLDRATSMYRNYRRWRPLMLNAMQTNFSWDASAKSYERVYRDLLASKRGEDASDGEAAE